MIAEVLTSYGLVGTGLLGAPMALRLQQVGLPVQVYNRSRDRTRPLAEAGVRVAESLGALVQGSDGIMLVLSDAEAIAATILSPEVVPLLPGKTILQMGTIAPSQSRAIARRIETAGGEYLEAPVLGSIPEAKAGTLLVMVGSSPEQFQRWQPLFQAFGPDPRHIGPVGAALGLKLALNQLIAAETAAFALSLVFAQTQGVAVEDLMAILRQSALYAPTFDKKLTRMLERNYANPNFPTRHLAKDVRLFLEEASREGLGCAGLLGVDAIVEQTLALGNGAGTLADQDYSALFEAIRRSLA